MTTTDLGALELAVLIARRELSSLEVVDAHLERIARFSRLNAVVTLDAEGARSRARTIDAALARGEDQGPLAGVPFTLKDMHATAGIRTTVGLVERKDHVPREDGLAARRLKAAGAVLLGKTNMALNVESDGDLFGRPLNPWDETRTTGGSSGGAGAALAARLTPLEVGTDMSGSIRMPAHYCGVFGFKPTMHRIPQVGVVSPWPPNLPRMDRWFGVMGPMARNIADLQVALRILAGPDPGDPESPPVALRDPVVREPSGLRLAYTPAISSIPSSERQRAAIESFVTRLRDAGARIVEAPLPFAFDDILQAFRRTMQISLRAMAGATGAPPGLRDLAGDPVGVVELLAALDERDDWVRRFQAFLEPHDAWICPTTPDAAFSHRPRGQPIVIDGQSVSPQVIDHPCLLATYTGCPSLVVPIGLVTSPDLPIGVQLHAPRWHDDRLLDVGAAVSKIIGELPSPSLA